MATKMKNVTFTLPIELIEKLKEYSNSHYIASINAGVKEALEEFAMKMEKEKLKNEMIEASKDVQFMSDLEENMKIFEKSDSESIRRTQEW